MRVLPKVGYALLMVAGWGCQATQPNSSAPTFRGPVVEVSPSGTRFLIQDEPPGASTGRIWVGVFNDTRIRRSNGSPARASDIRPRMVLSVWTNHILETDPAQTVADTIVVESKLP